MPVGARPLAGAAPSKEDAADLAPGGEVASEGLRHFSYRPEIDGLRAVAVIAVVLYHAKLAFPGGYVGVDVFFVISGYLITSLILRDIDAERFNTFDFWERRVRRIAPALLAASALTFALGWFFFLPPDFERLAAATIALTFFGSNVYHWRLADYFGPQADSLPLLHTWSLSLEEQFYLFLPIVLYSIACFRRSWVTPSLAMACVVSLVLEIGATSRYPAACFYLLPPRAWELLLGSLLAASQARESAPQWPFISPIASRRLREAASAAGLVAIAASAAMLDHGSVFPGTWALVPTLGSVAFLWANGDGLTATGGVLSWKPVVFVGKVSYSFYLLHWPLLVFPLYWFADEMSWAGRLGLVMAAFLAAIVSWAIVETPVRSRRVLAGRRSLMLTMAASFLVLVALSYHAWSNRGLPSRFSDATRRYAPSHVDFAWWWDQVPLEDLKQGTLIPIGSTSGPPEFLVWGDSHAHCMLPAIDDKCRELGKFGYAVLRRSTAPVVDFVGSKSLHKPGTLEYTDEVVRLAIARKIPTVILVAFWTTYSGDPTFEESLGKTVRTLNDAGIRVVIVRDTPTLNAEPSRMLIRALALGRDPNTVGVALEEHRARNREVDQMFQRLAGPRVMVLDPAPFFVDDTGRCRCEIDGTVMYFDPHHLTVSGARRLKDLFGPVWDPRHNILP
jgi:peptidoglycan/LPS O-acetylase OafA/YrhL